MSFSLRMFLLISAAIVLFFIVRKIRSSEFEITDSIFWFLFVLVLVFLALFPQAAFLLSRLFGFESPANFIFLAVIAILLIRVFSLNAKVAHLRAKVNLLIQEIAMRSRDSKDEQD